MPIGRFNPALPDDETERIWKKCLPIMDIWNVDGVVMHPGSNSCIEDGIESAARFPLNMLDDLSDETKLAMKMFQKQEMVIGSTREEVSSIV